MTTTNGLEKEREEDELLTSKQAKDAFKKAGLSEPTFHRRVQSGEIQAILEEGRQRGARYPRSQVMASINRTKSKKIKMANVVKSATLDRATVQDMPEIGELLKTFFSKVNVEKRTKWLEKNPEIGYVVRSEGKIVGCAFIVPLPEEKILKILDALVKPPTRSDDIPLFEAGKHYCLYARSVVVLPSESKIHRRYWAARLISGVIQEIIKMGERGIIIDKIYAQTDTGHVEKLLKRIGFSQLVSPIGSKNFVLDIDSSGSIYAMQYKKALILSGELEE